MTCGPGAHVAREQALRGCLAAGREKEGELVTTPRCQSAPESFCSQVSSHAKCGKNY